MSELTAKLQADLENKLVKLCFIHDQTALHVFNEFYELRNKIDIDAEELLARLRKAKLDDDAEEVVKVNKTRDEFITILRELEDKCLSQLSSSKKTNSTEAYGHYKQRIEMLNQCPGNRLEEIYTQLFLEILNETYQLEKRLLGEHTIMYIMPVKKKQLGHLVNICGDRLRCHEVECIQTMLRCLKKENSYYSILRNETLLQTSLEVYWKSLACVKFNQQIIVDNNFMIMIRLMHHFESIPEDSNSKFIYIGKPDHQTKNSIIERDFVEYRFPERFKDLQIKNIEGFSSDLGVFCFIRKELHVSECKLASLDFLASPHADRLEILLLNDIRLERFNANLFSKCVNLKKLKIDIYGEGVVITSLEFLRPLKNLASLDLCLLNFDLDLSVLQDFQFLTELNLFGSRDSTGKASYPKINVDVVLRQLSALRSLTDLQFKSVEIDKISKRQFADFKSLQNVTFFDTRGCKKLTKSFDIRRKFSRALSALDIRFIPGDSDSIHQILNLLEYSLRVIKT